MDIARQLVGKINLKFSSFAIIAYLAAGMVLLSAGLQDVVPVDKLTRDTIALLKGEFYYGILSTTGLLFLCASGMVCLFSYFLLRKDNNFPGRGFLLSAAAISFVLLLDDMLLLHEEVFPRYFGISENYFYLLYPVMLISFIFYFFRLIISTQVIILLSALTFLGLSIISDKIFPQSGRWFIIEDGFKLLGITGWFCYTSHTCYTILKDKLNIGPRAVENG